MDRPGLTRRHVVAGAAGFALASGLPRYGPLLDRALAAGMRGPGSLPDPSRPAGTPDASMPFDHVVVVMQENHSFDNYFGMLPRRGQPRADGFAFDANGTPTNANPYKNGYITVQHSATYCQPGSISQSWKATHGQIDGGRMDGFPANPSPASMLYWDQADLPFYYSLATTFCVGDRWFSSAPCQTYPNRRFLLAGTAFGLISTDTNSITQDPPNGTIVDRLDAHGLTWRDYFTDVPATGVIFSVPAKHPQNIAPLSQFLADCATGNLPAVSFVDSDIGVAGVVADGTFGQVPAPFAAETDKEVGAQNQDEEDPSDISLGENFVSTVVGAVLSSPAWQRILLVWTYDEHGGYYDHVPPPAAIPPDNIPPKLGPNDPSGGYDIYGPRVPAVVVSAHSRRNGCTSVLHDHTSILATIEAKWNLPAMTFRDANATTLSDFLDTSLTFPDPPKLAAPSDTASSEASCSATPPTFTVHPGAPAQPAGATDQLVVAYYGRRHRAHGGAVVRLATRRGTVKGLVVELLRGKHVLARAHVAHVGKARHEIFLRGAHGRRLPAGRFTLLVKQGSKTLVRRRVRLG